MKLAGVLVAALLLFGIHGPAPAEGLLEQRPTQPPPPITRPEAERQLQRLLEPGRQLLRSREGPWVVLHDLDPDGQPELFALVTTPAGAVVAMDELGRYGRLFEPDTAAQRFLLLVLRNRLGVLSLAHTVDLGEWRVLASTDSRPLSRAAPRPYGLSFVFQTAEGAVHLWIITGAGGGRSGAAAVDAPPLRYEFSETVSSKPFVLDVEGDGTLDFVTSEEELESSGRRETYLTWYRWNGSEFREHASTVVVRNLIRFLARARGLFLEGQTAQFVGEILDPDVVTGLRRQGKNDEQILRAFLGVAEDEPLAHIRELALPEIYQNPFAELGETDSVVLLELRAIDSSGTTHFYRLPVAMAHNPFVERQFSLSGPLVREQQP